MTPTLLVMAAGMGSRYGGGSNKQFDGVGPSGERLLDYAIFDARRAGFGRVVFVIRPDMDGVVDSLMSGLPRDLEVSHVFQDMTHVPPWFAAAGHPARVKPWGTVHAVLAARHAVTGPFAVVNADDFYGAASYQLAASACADAVQDDVSTIVGLRLDRTLSPHGPVTRGICEVAGDRLVRLEEVKGIERAGGGVRGQFHDGPRALTGREIASMNFWVFPVTIFDRLAGEFDAFLRRCRPDGTDEAMLPEAIGALVAAGRSPVRVREAPGPWFGLTHRDDRPIVARGLVDLVARGVYPNPLWTVAAT